MKNAPKAYQIPTWNIDDFGNTVVEDCETRVLPETEAKVLFAFEPNRDDNKSGSSPFDGSTREGDLFH